MREGEEVTLMDWGNAIVRSLVRDDQSGKVLRGTASLHLAGDVKATKKKLTWLCEHGDGSPSGGNVPVELIDTDHLINKDSLEEDEKLDVRRSPALRPAAHAALLATDPLSRARVAAPYAVLLRRRTRPSSTSARTRRTPPSPSPPSARCSAARPSRSSGAASTLSTRRTYARPSPCGCSSCPTARTCSAIGSRSEARWHASIASHIQHNY